MKKIVLLHLFLGLISSAFGQSCERTTYWGNTSYCLPKIAGFTECLHNPEIKELVASTTHYNNTVLGNYLLPVELSQFKSGKEISFSEYFRIETSTKTKDVAFTKKDFDEFASYMSTQFKSDEKMAELVNKAEEEFEIGSLSSPVKIDEYSVHSSSKTFVILNSFEIEDTRAIQVATINILRLKDRVLFLYYYNDYNGKESIQSAKNQTDFIILSLFESNN